MEWSGPLPELGGVGLGKGASGGLELHCGFVPPLSWPRCPWGCHRALPQILIQGPALRRYSRRQNALYTEISYCWEGVFLPQFVNIHYLFHKCLILSEQSCAVVNLVGCLGTGSCKAELEPGASYPSLDVQGGGVGERWRKGEAPR